MKAAEEIQLLLEGNQRWLKGQVIRPNQDNARRAELAGGQNPFAAVFSCVDSRVPPELVFDRGLGDLFVIRTAAHVVDDAALGSIEFGVEELRIPLILVMGHKRCGAVSATVAAEESRTDPPGKIARLVDAIRSAVAQARGQSGDLVENSVREHVKNSVTALGASPLLNAALRRGGIKIVGARYDLDSGGVEIIAP